MSSICLLSLFLALTFIPLTVGTTGSESFLSESTCKFWCTSERGGTGNCISTKTKEGVFKMTHSYCKCKYENENRCQSSCSTCKNDFLTGCQKCSENDRLSPGIIAVFVIIPIVLIIGVIVTVCCCCGWLACGVARVAMPPRPTPPSPQPMYRYPHV